MACLIDPLVRIVLLIVPRRAKATGSTIIIFISQLKKMDPVYWDLEQCLVYLALKIGEPGGVILIKVEAKDV